MENSETAAFITVCSFIFILIMSIVITNHVDKQNEREQKVLIYQLELEHNNTNPNQIRDSIK